MSKLEIDLEGAFSELQDKLYQSSTIHLRYLMVDKDKKFLTRQSVLSIYSTWESFLKKSLQIYLQGLNELGLSYDEISDEYLAFQTDEICSFKNPKTNHETVKKISRHLFDM